jgi:ubiquinone/menaquinone biosynthesis C-methylase UbiE
MATERAKEYARKMFNCMASRYESTLAGRHSDKMKKAALRCLDQDIGGSLLDVGCGPGLLLAILAGRYPILHLAGLDIAPAMVRVAKERMGDRADVRLGDAEYLPWHDASFNYIFCVDSFHHYPNAKRALSEFRRVLMPDGRLLLAEPTMPTPLRQLLNPILRLLRMGDVQMYGCQKMTTLLEECRFKSIQWRESGSWGFVASAVAG